MTDEVPTPEPEQPAGPVAAGLLTASGDITVTPAPDRTDHESED